MVCNDRKEEIGMATVLANPTEMIERGAPHLIRNEVELGDLKHSHGLTVLPIWIRRLKHSTS